MKIGIYLWALALISCKEMTIPEHSNQPLHQVEITESTELLYPDGSLKAQGWARRPFPFYNSEAVSQDLHAHKKDWEYYNVLTPTFNLSVTMANIQIASFAMVEFVDYSTKKAPTNLFFKLGASQLKMHRTPWGSTVFKDGENFLEYVITPNHRTIRFNFVKGVLAPAFKGEVVLKQSWLSESLTCARPFEDPHYFFYENKIFNFVASGSFKVGDRTVTLPVGQSLAILDWGRGVWPTNSQWYWGYGGGYVGNRLVGFNLGYGYGDDSAGSVNSILVDGKLHKLESIKLNFNSNDGTKPWRVQSNDGRLNLTFEPQYLHRVDTDLGVYYAHLNKVFGRFSGTLVLDDGERLEIKNFLGFAEKMHQRW